MNEVSISFICQLKFLLSFTHFEAEGFEPQVIIELSSPSLSIETVLQLAVSEGLS